MHEKAYQTAKAASQAQLIANRDNTIFQDEFLRRYRNYVYSLAKEVGQGHGLFGTYTLDALASFGFWGLFRALKNFDPHAGFQFMAYARPRIKGAILDRARAEAQVSRWYQAKAKEIYAEFNTLRNRADDRAARRRTAKRFQISESQVEKQIQIATDVWQEPTPPETMESLLGAASDPEPEFALREQLNELIETLPPGLQELIRRHYFGGELKSEIARSIGRSGEWVRGEIERANRLMREAAKRRGLRDFLPGAA